MPEVTMLTSVVFGFLLGLEHALDADHIVAVTTIVSRSRSLLRAALVGLSWGIGHTITLFAVGFGGLVLKLTIPDWLALSMEFVVGVILVILGVFVVKGLVAARAHVHEHRHGDERLVHSHSHKETLEHKHRHIGKSLLIGMVHGLAGSGVITVLVLSSMSSVVQGLFFFLLFGIGSILGMLIFSGLIGLPFKFTARFSLRLNFWFQGTAGLVSIVLGFFIMWQTGFVAGLFFTVAR